MSGEELDERLEMLLVMQWLDEGADDDGGVALSVSTAAFDLGLESDRAGLMRVMAALGALEDRGAVTVAWPTGPAGREARVTLAPDLRRDARRLFRGPG
ncbi:MAG: hypothetical protein AB7V42_04390 [Thermoleophilia bacterium]